VETRKLEDLIPYDRNPRSNDKAVEHVLESLKKHGQVAPIIIVEGTDSQGCTSFECANRTLS